MFSSLRSRLLLSYLAIILLTLLTAAGSLGIALGSVQRRLMLAQLRSNLTITQIIANSMLRNGATPQQALNVLHQRQQQAGSSPLAQLSRAIVVDRNGRVLADTDPSESLVGELLLAANGRPLPAVRPLPAEVRTTDGRRWYFAGQLAREPDANGQRVIVAHIAPVRLISPQVAQAMEPLLWAAGAALLLSLLLAIGIARSVSRPLASITEATEAIVQGNYDHPLADDPGSPDEIRRLSASFSHMMQQVAASRQAQREFIANVSHDLKTPITSIQGFAQALVDGTANSPEAQKRAATIIHDEASRMARLVEQLLDLARLEAGQVEFRRDVLDLGALLRACCERLQLRAQEAGITLECQAGQGPSVVGDGDRLMQVFTNLVDNALKATSTGGKITVTVETRDGNGKQPGWADISVTDTGRGIPPEDVPRLFERFYQVEKSRAGGRSGSGLGLAIVREIVAAHGGRVDVQSVVGLGTRFTVSLPLAPSS